MWQIEGLGWDPLLKSENPGGDYDKPRGTQPYLFPHSQFDRI